MKNVPKYVRAFACVILIFVALILWWYLLGTLQISDAAIRITAFLTGALALFTGLTWMTYDKLATLAEQQNQIAARNSWLTGALESHSTVRLMMDAHDRGIPVMWWDPNQETWDTFRLKVPGSSERRHRQIARLPVAVLYLPEAERASGLKAAATSAEPLTKAEIKAIENERKRLRHHNGELNKRGGRRK